MYAMVAFLMAGWSGEGRGKGDEMCVRLEEVRREEFVK